MTTPKTAPDLTCLICRSHNVDVLEVISCQEIILKWQQEFLMDIEAELRGFEQMTLCHCQQCQLRFFSPQLAGSDQLYAQLEKLDWYYNPHKWEHDAALLDISPGDRVLEVGCGFGDFVASLIHQHQIDAVGIELNSSAVKQAQQRGLPVDKRDLFDMVESHAETFDVVCNFQVLEHVPDPKEFIDACIALLKPGGKLLMCVPDNDSYLRLDSRILLNMPPHHITQWTQSAFENLPDYCPLILQRISFEPLASYHLNYYTQLQLNRIPHVFPARRILKGFIIKALLPLIRFSGLYRRLKGQSIYVSYIKK